MAKKGEEKKKKNVVARRSPRFDRGGRRCRLTAKIPDNPSYDLNKLAKTQKKFQRQVSLCQELIKANQCQIVTTDAHVRFLDRELGEAKVMLFTSERNSAEEANAIDKCNKVWAEKHEHCELKAQLKRKNKELRRQSHVAEKIATVMHEEYTSALYRQRLMENTIVLRSHTKSKRKRKSIL